jgi:hypothetical protein
MVSRSGYLCIAALKAVIRFADRAQAWIALAPAVAFMTFPRKRALLPHGGHAGSGGN